MNEVSELFELAKKSTPGRNYDRLDSCGGGIKYQCIGNDGSLVLQCDHKNNEYGFIGPKSMEDEAFFLACKPETIIAIAEEFMMLQEQLTATTNSLTNAQEALKSAGIEADTVQAGVMELKAQRDGIAALAEERRQFIVNGVETGDITLPVIDTDPATVIYERCLLKPMFAHDAYLNAVRAEGADAAAAKIRKAIPAFKDIHCGAVKECAGIAEMVAAKFTTGNPGKDGSHE